MSDTPHTPGADAKDKCPAQPVLQVAIGMSRDDRKNWGSSADLYSLERAWKPRPAAYRLLSSKKG